MAAQDFVPEWVAAISAALPTEDVVGSVVDMLLQLAADPHLQSSIPADVWSWLNERPSLPSVCRGRYLGSGRDTVRTARAPDDIGILTSYLILVWSEWEPLDREGFTEMRISIRQDFSGVGNGYYRAELLQRLDYILGKLDRLSGRLDVRLGDEKLWYGILWHHSNNMESRYGVLKRVVQEVDQKTTGILNCMPPNLIFLDLLTLMDLNRIRLHLHVCPASPVSIASHLERSTLYEMNHFDYFHPSLSPCALLTDSE